MFFLLYTQKLQTSKKGASTKAKKERGLFWKEIMINKKQLAITDEKKQGSCLSEQDMAHE